MSEVKHTPGPWVVWSEEGHTKTGLCRYSVCHHVGNRESDDHTCVAESLGEDETEALGNARLIAAAPELLEALRIAADIIGHPDDAMSKHIRSVIAKAEGA